jgi:hypothetical protein
MHIWKGSELEASILKYQACLVPNSFSRRLNSTHVKFQRVKETIKISTVKQLLNISCSGFQTNLVFLRSSSESKSGQMRELKIERVRDARSVIGK